MQYRKKRALKMTKKMMKKIYCIHINLKIEEVVCNGTLLSAKGQVIKN